MKLTAILILVACLESQARGYAQNITISVKDGTLEQVFKVLKRQTGYNFIYTREQLEHATRITLELRNVTLQQALDQCFSRQPVTYTIQDRFVIIRPRTEPIPAPKPADADTARPSLPVKLNGWVTGENGEPLGGATVIISQPGKPAIGAGTTDERGNFKLLNLPKGSYTLVVSFIGYEKIIREVTISDKMQILGVAMKKSTSTLDAIQTTAYSKTTMRFNTGDITTVTSEEIARNPVPNVLQSLQARVPGMFVTEMTGKTNGAFQVQIRSLNTLSGGVAASPSVIAQGGQPLYIVDGVEYPAGDPLPMANFNGFAVQLRGNALNYLDPSVIESINVLKGADATAVYGSRGAFGVILITTKKARAGKPSLTINAAQGITTQGVAPKLLNLPQYLALRREAFANDGVKPAPTDYDVNGTWDTTKGTDWRKFFLGSHASTTRANATWSGGSANSNFLIGANYSAIGNIERHKGSVRQGGINFSLNTATNDRKVTMALSGSYTNNLDNTVPADFSGSAITQAPDAPYPFLPNGKLNWAGGTNPAAVLNAIYSNSTDNLIANVNLTFTPVEGLSFSAVGGFNLLTAKEFQGQPSAYFNPATFTPAETYSLVNLYRVWTLSADPRAEFIHTWGKARLDVIAGGSLRDQVSQTNFISGSGFASDQLLMDPATANSANIGVSYNSTPKRYIGGFAVINFRWADKYILDLSGRRDGSSVFGNNRQFGDFGSVAGAWIISEEPWFNRLRKVVDFLKLKGSYGLVGGSAIAPYSYINSYGAANNSYGGGLSLLPLNLANPYLHWETNRNLEGGLNVDLFKGRLNVEAIYYSDKVGDQLTSQPLATITGFPSFMVNSAAKIRSYGAEFAVATVNIRNKNFSWSTKINLTIPRTKLLAFPGLGNLVSNVNYVVGKPITGIKLIRYAGVDPATGNYNFYNAAGQKGEFTPFLSPVTLNSQTDRTEFVDRAPKWYGGILNTLSYKNFSMDFLVSVTKRMGPNYLGFQSFSPGTPNTNIPVDIANMRWRKPGDVTTVPKATQGLLGFLDQANFLASTGAYSNATYARLQNLSVSYRLPARLVRKAHMSALSVYVAGQNLLTVSKYKGLDPENMLSNRIPPLRVFTGGLNVGF
ncbi:MAG TPA: SusC/RagA family TonB-linked outer membrane protein [Puia sp.]|nr:SusC/RagA family TonB-linked outer membrane protein [Puia sp.]